MQYKCDVCHDSGSKNQTGDYLDCPACDMPHTRKALNDFVKSLGPTHPEDVALAIHQRALAMAPKQEAPAGWKLVPEEPTGNMFRAAAKIDNEMFAGGSSHGAEDGQVWAAMYDAAPESPVAAPEAANGTLTDAKLPEKMSEEMREAMWEAITRHGAANLEYWIEDLYNDIRSAAIALSGAKGN